MVFYRLKINEQTGSARLPTLGKGAGGACTNGAASVANGGIGSTNLCIAGGPILKEDKQTHTADEAGKYITSLPTDEEKAADPDKTEQALAQELLDVAQEWHTANFNFDALEISSYNTDDNFKAAVAAAVGNLKEPYDSAKHGEIISRLISNKYGDSKETFNNKFWEPLSKLPVPKVALGTDSDGTVAQISDTETTAKVLLHAAKQRQSKTEKRAANTTGKNRRRERRDKATAAECKATEEGKCDEEKCTWDKDKKECKVKKGAEVICYVMNTTLFLAFLLLQITFSKVSLSLLCSI
uniref:Variant surface glycoprotein 1125.5491 n=1 Tax=Trypanosoma brucei TaxID=5691 RepID=A0A1J0RCR1_9TRYP|nr:variant surface glycoprotein 1125.5491 [Trypanosoma brucei]